MLWEGNHGILPISCCRGMWEPFSCSIPKGWEVLFLPLCRWPTQCSVDRGTTVWAAFTVSIKALEQLSSHPRVTHTGIPGVSSCRGCHSCRGKGKADVLPG